ncbi:MAG: DUF2975 domain-containing protein [Balneolaceae bacterium]|nr:DUF2975 domain-containing protein [Balneolaceae bacterium]
MKLKKYLSISYLLYFSFAVTFIFLAGVNGYLMFQKTIGFWQPTNVIVGTTPVLLSNNHDATTSFEHEELTVSIINSNSAQVVVYGNPLENSGAYIYHSFVIFIEKISFLFALFWGALLFKNLGDENYFDSKNTRYLFLIGWTLFLTSIFYEVLNFLPQPILDAQPFIEEGIVIFERYSTEYHMAIGLMSIVFGYVLKEATRIHEEQKLTV